MENYNVVLECFEKNDEPMNATAVAEKTGISVPGVQKICSKLQEYGIIERNGSKRDGRWVVK